MNWTSGYVADIGYTYGYYSELNPNRVKLAFLNAGLVAPEIGVACELGFGQGLSTNLHAAASTVTWWGTDFNPTQAGFAQELSSASGANVQLFDEAFTEFCTRSDLPEFDYIGLHGIWSWISDENRKIIVDFVRRKLKVGGVLYISYNTMPGWAAFSPMRHLMTQYVDAYSANADGSISHVNNALAFAQKLLDVNPLYAKNNPQVTSRIEELKTYSQQYLAHEYFNRDWHPMHFATMSSWLEPAKVQFACSANYFDHVDLINLSIEHQNFLKDIPNISFKESVRDFLVNQQFRKDYWVKGVRKINKLDQINNIRSIKFVMSRHLSEFSFKVSGYLGEAALHEQIYNPIIHLMSDYKIRSAEEIEKVISSQGVNFGQLVQALLILCNKQFFAIANEELNIGKIKKYTDRLNQNIIMKSRGSDDFGYLASPVTGGGIAVNRFNQIFILALSNKKVKPQEWALFANQILAAQGQKIIKDGKPIESQSDQLAELTDQANDFATKQLPVLKALQIV